MAVQSPDEKGGRLSVGPATSPCNTTYAMEMETRESTLGEGRPVNSLNWIYWRVGIKAERTSLTGQQNSWRPNIKCKLVAGMCKHCTKLRSRQWIVIAIPEFPCFFEFRNSGIFVGKIRELKITAFMVLVSIIKTIKNEQKCVFVTRLHL